MMTWACKLMLVTEGGGRDVLINCQMRGLEIAWQQALTLRTWLPGTVSATLSGTHKSETWMMVQSTSNPEAWVDMEAATLSARFSKY